MLDKVDEDKKPLFVKRQKKQTVVVMPYDEYTALEETFYLLSNRANAEHLFKSRTQIEKGQSVTFNMDELKKRKTENAKGKKD